MKRLLFVCGKNRLRSPTAERVFASYPGIEVMSAGVDRDADHRVSDELLEWADLVFVMEETHRRKLSAQFRSSLRTARIVCLGIPDDYDYMAPELVALLERKVGPFVR